MSTKKMIHVLHVEDSQDDAELIARELRKGYAITHQVVSTGRDLTQALKEKWDIVLSDFSMPNFSGLEALEMIRATDSDVPFVFVSGTIGEERAVTAIKSGATDFVSKDSLKRLVSVVERVLKEAEGQRKLKAAEEELKKSEALYKLLAENSTDIIAIVGADGLVKYISQAIQAVCGYAPEDVVGTAGLDIIQPVDFDHFSSTLTQARTDAQPFQVSFHARRKDGREIWLETIGKAINEPTNAGRDIITVTRDITERRLADARMREQATLIDKASDAILARDLQHSIYYWNQGAARLYGWSRSEAINASARMLLYANPEMYDAAMAEILEKGEYAGELEQVNKNGEKLVVLVRWTLLRDEMGNPKSILAINSDITERRSLEQQFLRAQRLESIGTLAGGIAHDLNNVLTPVMLAVDVLKEGNLAPDHLDLVAMIETSARRGTSMVQQVLSFARGVEGNPEPLRIADLLTDLERVIKDTFPKNIAVSMHVGPELWLVKGDFTQLYQVLVNLAVNARDAMPNGGQLSISAENCTLDQQYSQMQIDVAPGDYVVIRFEDTGSGMPANVLDKIL